jgi:hypothetical protein
LHYCGWSENGISKGLLLEQLQSPECWAGICEVFYVFGLLPVLVEIGQVVDESGVGQEVLGSEVVEIVWIGERLDKLEMLE